MTLLARPGARRQAPVIAHRPAEPHEARARGDTPPGILEIRQRLSGSGYLALRDVSVIARDGVITLAGRLQSQFLKQVAQEIASSAEGVREVVNRIEVDSPEHRDRAANPYLRRVCDGRERVSRDLGVLGERTTTERNSQPCWFSPAGCTRQS
jgi:hypothetical protein